jgi:hypothetical protein
VRRALDHETRAGHGISASAICAVTSAARTDTPPAPRGTRHKLQRVDRFREEAWAPAAVRTVSAAVNGGVWPIRPIIRCANLREACGARHRRAGATAVRKNTSASGSSVRAAEQRDPEHQAGNAAADGEQQALAAVVEHAARLAPMATRCHFPASRRAPGHREIRQVDARDQQDETDRARAQRRWRTSLSTRRQGHRAGAQRSALSACRYTS